MFSKLYARLPMVQRFWLRRMRNRLLARLRRTHNLADPKLLRTLNDEYITIYGERFPHARHSLELLIERVNHQKKMVEVGSLCGFSTRLFANHFQRVISVDPYIARYDSGDINSNPHRLAIAEAVFAIRFFDDPSVEQIKEPSEQATGHFASGELDCVYSDADHRYEAVKRDIEIWRPKVRAGGYIAGDDYNWPDVKRAVEESFATYEIFSGRWLALIG